MSAISDFIQTLQTTAKKLEEDYLVNLDRKRFRRETYLHPIWGSS